MAERREEAQAAQNPVAGEESPNQASIEEASNEEAKRAAAQRPLQPLILPTDSAWKDVLIYFQDRLGRKEWVADIVREMFTDHEASLLLPADTNGIEKLQAENQRRYNRIVALRFAKCTQDTAFKLTMAFFGVAIVPLIPSFKPPASSYPEDAEEPSLYAVRKPLGFLTANKQRNYGFDSLQGEYSEQACLLGS